MKRILPVLVVATLSAWTATAQNSPAVQTDASARAQAQTSANTGRDGVQASGSGSAATGAAANGDKTFAGAHDGTIHDGTKINAALKSSLDAKKNKPGDAVEARTTEDVKENGKVVLKKGTRLEGHVTQAQARASGESQSRLGIVFDHAVLRDGQEVPFNATIQALEATQSAASADAGGDDLIASGGGRSAVAGTTRGGGGLVGGVASTAGATAGGLVNTASSVPVNAGGTLSSATRTTGAVGGLTTAGHLTSESSGVFGLEGLSLDSAASNATAGSMVVSGSRNVHLASGTQMLLTASGQAH